eukprot:CAMPEP_0118661916 /NCGR_PEP_ID=MMETSP0785-20121206/16542_1 /TAXON_ID=91992 /ORGANISM="Bolidomonas pacifica, Strain CCMP 1866" /LENGTH=1391 /DNA_ID=CAMNT_0006555403 /DNA_START=25 /DNA_END=4197 /DNA_ORIENTATION=+
MSDGLFTRRTPPVSSKGVRNDRARSSSLTTDPDSGRDRMKAQNLGEFNDSITQNNGSCVDDSLDVMSKSPLLQRREISSSLIAIKTKKINQIGGSQNSPSTMSPSRPIGKSNNSQSTFKTSRSTSPESAGGRAHRKLSLSSRLNPISFEKEDDDDILVGTEILETIEPEDFIELVVSSAKAKASDWGVESHHGGGKSQFNDDFMRSNFANVIWELKACRQLLTVATYMSNDLQQESVFSKIMESAHYILKCDRVSLFLVDHSTNTLSCVHSKDNISQKIPIGTGIIGEVAKTGMPLNIKDAYKDTRFFPGVDRQTGYRTKGVICFPIKFDPSARVEAVIQAINKKPSLPSMKSAAAAAKSKKKASVSGEFTSFTASDESMLSYLAAEAAICLKNANRLGATAKEAQKNAVLGKLLSTLSVDLDTFKAIESIVECATELLDAERVSLFLKEGDQLVCNVSMDISKGFKIPLTKGIAGHVATTGKVLNIKDAYDCPYFNPSVDSETNFLTQSVLCGPVSTVDGDTIAIIQAVNKKNGEFFTNEDEQILVGISNQAGIGLRNAKLFEAEKYQRALNASLIEVATAVSSNLDTQHMFQTIMDSARSLLACDRCSLFLIDHETDEFWSYVTESEGVEFRFPLDKGIIGQVALNRSTLNIPDAYKVPSFNAEADLQSGYRTKSILCLPVITSDDHMVAVIEMINKLEDPTAPPLIDGKRKIHSGEGIIPFSVEDEIVLSKFTDVVAGALSSSLVYNELEQHNDMVEGTLQGITNYVVTLDKTGNLKTSNHSLTPLFGANDEEMMSTSYLTWISGNNNETLKKDITKVFVSGEEITRKNEVINIASRGGNLSVSYNIVPLWAEKKEKKRYSRRKSSLIKDSTTAKEFENISGISSSGKSGLSRMMDGASSSAGDSESIMSRSPVLSSRLLSSSPHAEKRDSKRSNNFDDDDKVLQGVVIVLENITEERLMQSAIQRYQRRLNEMEEQVQEFSDLKSKLQSLDIEALHTEDVTPETTRALANLALCLDTPLSQSNINAKPVRMTQIKAKFEDAILGGGSPGVLGSPSTASMMSEYRSYLSPKSLKNWGWDVLEIDEVEVLRKSILVMFDELNLNGQWAIPSKKLNSFVCAIDNKYNDVPFHNLKHGIAVAQTAFYFIACTEVGQCLTSLQAFALIVSALCHDLDHPGHTNAFEVNSDSELALIYNDTSVLENHHCACASIVMREEENNILSGLDRGEFREFRSVMCSAILSTDMSTHFNLLGRFRDAIHTEGGWNPEQSADKLLLIDIVLHSADLSNPCRPWELCRKWSLLVGEEFNAQVSKEKSMGLPFLPFMESDSDESKAKQETSFIEFIIEPMWKDVVEFLPEMSFALNYIEENKGRWKEISKKYNSSRPGSRGS